MMLVDEDNYLAHYGILRRSGRYPWGSGKDPLQRSNTFLSMVADLRKEGVSDTAIARGFGMSTTDLRNTTTIARAEKRASDIAMAQRYKDRGLSNVAIGQRMGINESSVRSLLEPGKKDKVDILNTTSRMLKDQVERKSFIDVGTGVEHHLGVSQTKLASALALLKEQGYVIHTVKVEQLGTGHLTEMKVLAKPGTTQRNVWENRHNIKQVTEISEDGGRTFFGIKPPTSVKSSRIAVNYAEDGGSKADGVIYVRRGIDDISLGTSRYAQVRIAVDGTHYIKGMAMYKDDLPPGVDLVFNTNKSKTDNKLDAFKELKKDLTGKIDPDNPFGAVISRQHGVMNIVNEEGSWDTWSRSLSSQMLSKQSPVLAKTQLDMTYERSKNRFDEINSLTNPAVKKKLLEDYAEDVDASAWHLKAAALPRQSSHVILPIDSMKETEVYAPNFRNGERVVLVRFPHGGIFEIPELTVNNRQSEAKSVLGDARDAIGIHSNVAKRLSGADFDGDTVLVIPNRSGAIATKAGLRGLKDFDPQAAYPAYPGMPKISARTKQIQMGDVSNLITDMTIKGASDEELARAVRHSMVVIDAEKHNLNYKESARVNGIAQLKEKYQGGKRAGAATVISRKKHDLVVPERKPRSAAKGGPIDKATGKKMYEETGATYTDRRTGKVVKKTEKVKQILEVKDVNQLSSGTPMEKIYADHSNRLKTLANEARRIAVNTSGIPYSPSAKLAYANEVRTLDAKLNLALRNRPLERQAQVLANTVYQEKRRANPDMDATELKRVKAQALAEARTRTGAKKQQIEITKDEWDAIQAGAISNNKLTQILNNANITTIKELATPKRAKLMTATKTGRAKTMAASGYTQAEIADALGVSLTTLKSALSEGG